MKVVSNLGSDMNNTFISFPKIYTIVGEEALYSVYKKRINLEAFGQSISNDVILERLGGEKKRV